MAINIKTMFSSKEKGKDKKSKAPKSTYQEWRDALIWAISAAVIIRWAIFTPYKIPTPSMEDSLMVGDFLIVNKLSYGPKTPETPLQMPLLSDVHLDWIKLPVFRLPGFSDIQNNDVVVFHFPGEVNKPSDMRTSYIKRCVAIPGDKIEVKQQQVYINDKPLEAKGNLQHGYQVSTAGGREIREENFLELGINLDPSDKIKTQSGYRINMTPETAEKLKKISIVEKVSKLEYLNFDRTDTPTFPTDSRIFTRAYENFPFSRDNYGPIIVPKEGMTIELNEKNTQLYGKVILLYEHNKNPLIDQKTKKITLDGKAITSYTFKQDYYFMMGDNRHNSLDSRYFGFVPMDHVIGKAVYTWWSVSKYDSWTDPGNKIRWDKIFKKIE